MDAPASAAYRGTMRSRAAFTLLELVTALAVAGILLAVAGPSAIRTRDTLAVRAAHRQLTSAVALTRSTAIVAGGATLVIDVAGARAYIETAGGGTTRTFETGRSHGVSFQTVRGSSVALRYDALGIGRMTAASIQLRRGSVQVPFVVSSYGRVRL
jgi:prepilin-type N-terminal cleavage/methylation domain-containing protein